MEKNGMGWNGVVWSKMEQNSMAWDNTFYSTSTYIQSPALLVKVLNSLQETLGYASNSTDTYIYGCK